MQTILRQTWKTFVGIALVWLTQSTASAQHVHLNVGATNQAQGMPLYFQNGGTYGTNGLFVMPLPLATNGPYAGHYITTGFSPTVIGTGFFQPPAPGTQVRLRFIGASGPADASFNVWDVPGFNEEDEEASAITFSVPTGTTNATQSILLSQNNGQAGADPFGHIHGRAFSASKPGLYAVSFRAYDASINGPFGVPLHNPSDILSIYFQAGITIAGITRTNDTTTLTFATFQGKTYYVHASTNLGSSTAWQDISGPVAGANRLEFVTDSEPGVPHKFYRLRVTTP
jgi:hypothetical protein